MWFYHNCFYDASSIINVAKEFWVCLKKILPQPTGRGCGFPPDLHGLRCSETHGRRKPPRSKLRPATGLSGGGVWSWRLMQPSPWSQLGEYTLQIFSHREDKHLKSLLQGNSQACSVLIYFQIAFQWNFKKYLNPVSRSCPHSSDYRDWWGRRSFCHFKIVSEGFAFRFWPASKLRRIIIGKMSQK